MNSHNSPDKPQETFDQGTLVEETITDAPRSTEEIASEIARVAMSKNPYEEQEKRAQGIIDVRGGEDLTLDYPSRSMQPTTTSTKPTARTRPKNKSRRQRDVIETPNQLFNNSDSLSQADIDAAWDAMTPEEREEQIRINRSGAANARANAKAAVETQKTVKNEEKTPSNTRRNLDSRNAFGRVISLDYFSISPERISGTSEEDLAKVSVENLRAALFNNSGRYSVKGVSFSPSEYTTIVRNPIAFSTAISATTLSARQIDPDIERRLAAAKRSSEHAFESKEEVMQKMLSGFVSELESLYKLRKEMNTPGYAHMNELTMRGLVSSVMNVSFNNLFEVVANQNGWDTKTRESTEKALLSKLLTGPQRDKVTYWKDLADLNITWNRAKQALTRQRLAQVRRKS